MLLGLNAWLLALFFFIAFSYAMVGFGGGSSYLALLLLTGMPYQKIPQMALICNLVVASGGWWHFYRAGHFRSKIVLPFLALSVPMAYLGGRLVIGKQLFCLILGFSLFFAAWRMFLSDRYFEAHREIPWTQAWRVGLPVGTLLGFLSGLVGIGGGIFLSPILLLMRWGDVKQVAASSSFFIVANSIAGLMGHLSHGAVDWIEGLPFGLVVFAGGQIGSRLGAYHVPSVRLGQLLGGLILYASIKLILEAL